MICWSVRLNRGRRRVTVWVEYHVIEGGALKFRLAGRGYNYPVNVIAFAAGEWASVENLSLKK
jgi:hypothetical protein